MATWTRESKEFWGDAARSALLLVMAALITTPRWCAIIAGFLAGGGLVGALRDYLAAAEKRLRAEMAEASHD